MENRGGWEVLFDQLNDSQSKSGNEYANYTRLWWEGSVCDRSTNGDSIFYSGRMNRSLLLGIYQHSADMPKLLNSLYNSINCGLWITFEILGGFKYYRFWQTREVHERIRSRFVSSYNLWRYLLRQTSFFRFFRHQRQYNFILPSQFHQHPSISLSLLLLLINFLEYLKDGSWESHHQFELPGYAGLVEVQRWQIRRVESPRDLPRRRNRDSCKSRIACSESNHGNTSKVYPYGGQVPVIRGTRAYLHPLLASL